MANEMWGGRFAEGPAAIMQEINASISFDKRLADQDIRGSIAQAEMLNAQGIIDAQSAEAIVQGLKKVKAEIDDGSFTFKASLEDIHMNVEARLAEIIGTPAGRLHTARSSHLHLCQGTAGAGFVFIGYVTLNLREHFGLLLLQIRGV